MRLRIQKSAWVLMMRSHWVFASKWQNLQRMDRQPLRQHDALIKVCVSCNLVCCASVLLNPRCYRSSLPSSHPVTEQLLSIFPTVQVKLKLLWNQRCSGLVVGFFFSFPENYAWCCWFQELSNRQKLHNGVVWALPTWELHISTSAAWHGCTVLV